MSEETETTDTTTDDDGGDAPLSVTDRLNWDAETQGDLPDGADSISLEDLKTFVSERDATTEAATTAKLTAQAEAAREAQRAQERNAGEAQVDIDHFNSVQSKLESTDEAERAQAVKDAKGDQYLRGAAATKQQGEGALMAQAFSNMLGIAHRELTASGETSFMPDPSSAEFRVWAVDTVNAFEGKGGFFGYAIDYGKQLGLKEGIAQGREEAERDMRINEGGEGTPNMPPAARSSSGRFDIKNMTTDQINANWDKPEFQAQMAAGRAS